MFAVLVTVLVSQTKRAMQLSRTQYNNSQRLQFDDHSTPEVIPI